MATRGGTTIISLLWSIIIISIVAGVVVLVLLRSVEPPSSPETMDENLVRFLVGCMRMGHSPVESFKSKAEEAEALVCHDSLRLLFHYYQSSGRMGRECLEAIKIIHDYNQTDVDIYICGFDYRRCPNRTRALKQFLTSREMKDELQRRR